ncbi:MAG TPA: efflux RND transporter periplasmic adaptor subunit [Gemmataceae bacterium]
MIEPQAPSLEPLEADSSPCPPLASRLRAFQVADGERRAARPSRRRLIGLIVLAALGAGGWAVYAHRPSNATVEVEAYTVPEKPGQNVLFDLTGFVAPRSKVVISPQVGGVISRVLLPEEGQKVKEGALLFEVENSRYKAEYLQAEAALAIAQAQLAELEHGARTQELAQALSQVKQAQAQLTMTTAEWQRLRRLVGTGAASPAEVERSRKTYLDSQMNLQIQKANYDLVKEGPRKERIDSARAEVKRAEATRDRARYYFEKTRIYAPSQGKGRYFTVLEKKVALGESIQAELGFTSLCVLADLDEMEAAVDVPERDLGLVNIGGPCTIIPDAHPEKTYRGRIDRMQPAVNRQRGVVQVKVAILDPDSYLLPDMNVRVLLLEESAAANSDERLPRIPQRALVPGADTPAVYVFDGKAARLRTIEIGATVGDRVEVRKGVQAKDKVLLPGSRTLFDGEFVRIRESNKTETTNGRDRS